MKKALLLFLIVVSGCVPYSERMGISNYLSVKGKTNGEIINILNKKSDKPIQKITPTGSTRYGSDDQTEAPVIVTYTDGSSASGFLTSTGRGRSSVNFMFTTTEERDNQKQVASEEARKAEQERTLNQEKDRLKFKQKYMSAPIGIYPYLAEVYCYNRKTLNIYKPDACGIGYNFLQDTGVGPNNSYDTSIATYNIMLKDHFNLTILMTEPNPFLGIKVDIRSRRTKQVVLTRNGGYIDTISITN